MLEARDGKTSDRRTISVVVKEANESQRQGLRASSLPTRHKLFRLLTSEKASPGFVGIKSQGPSGDSSLDGLQQARVGGDPTAAISETVPACSAGRQDIEHRSDAATWMAENAAHDRRRTPIADARELGSADQRRAW